MSFGAIIFAYGGNFLIICQCSTDSGLFHQGHGAFPTIQHDMKKPYNFRRSVCTAFFIIACMYLPVSTYGYLTYGDSLTDSIITSIQVLPKINNKLNFLHLRVRIFNK